MAKANICETELMARSNREPRVRHKGRGQSFVLKELKTRGNTEAPNLVISKWLVWLFQ